MTEKYTAYINMLATRDQALTTLAVMALGVVLTWLTIHTLPEPWNRRFYRLYLVLGAVIYVGLLLGLMLFPMENK